MAEATVTEEKIPAKVYSFVAIVGTLFDKHAYVIGSDDAIKYILKYHKERRADRYRPESSSERLVTGSPLDVINTYGRKGYYIATYTSGHSNQMKIWILEKEFCYCICSCHSSSTRLSTEDQGIDLKVKKEKYKSLLKHIGSLIINAATDSSDSGLDTEDYPETDSLKIDDTFSFQNC